MGVVDHYEDFYASHDHMPGSSRTMRVKGTVVFARGGATAELREHEGNPGINPQMLPLDLVLTPPGYDAPTTPALHPVPVEWSVDDPSIEYRQVQFFVVGTDDEPPPVIDVEHPE
ncbi:MAG TPA: hypothetical protein VGW10_18880 [Solirubrobacteraceae bacterium]|nr:hypothetical protein [Solirubrobacteraceae bacterium]